MNINNDLFRMTMFSPHTNKPSSSSSMKKKGLDELVLYIILL